MASISDRWHVTDRTTGQCTRSARYGTGKRWQVRYRDPSGESRNRSFDRKADAERYLVELQHRLNRGAYVDDRAGRVLFGEYAADWLDRRVFAATSRESLEGRLRTHLGHWSDWPLRSITPASIQRWQRELSDDLAPRTIKLLLINLGAILQGAVDDNLISVNPVRSNIVRPPSIVGPKLNVWAASQVLEVVSHVPSTWRPLVIAAAGCGLRQGEAFGLRAHDVDLVRSELHVRQQIRIERGQPRPALPKYGRTRTVPMPDWVASSLGERLESGTTLPGLVTAAPGVGGLLFFTRERKPLNRNYFNKTVWRPAIRAAGVPDERENGMHALRHACASLWLEHGVSIRARCRSISGTPTPASP